MRYLGIDYGSGKVGLALSDEAGTMGFPHGVMKSGEHLLPALLSLIKEREVGAVVIGEAPSLKEEIHTLSEALKTQDIKVFFETEAYTTQEARRDIEGNRTRTEGVDAAAAALILTSYLSHAHDND